MKSQFVNRHMVSHPSVIFIASLSHSTFLSKLKCFLWMVIHDSTVLRFTSTSLLFKASKCTATSLTVSGPLCYSAIRWQLVVIATIDISLYLPGFSTAFWKLWFHECNYQLVRGVLHPVLLYKHVWVFTNVSEKETAGYLCSLKVIFTRFLKTRSHLMW